MEHEHTTLHIHNAPQKHTIRDFMPLIGMLTVVVIAAVVTTYAVGLEPMQGFMAWFFLLFGTLKIIRLKGFVEAYQMYDVIALRSRVYAYVYPFIEFGFGLAYLLTWQLAIVNVVVIVIMLIGAFGVYLKLKKKEEIPCACLGTVFKVPMTWVTLGEDLLMATMATFMLLA